MADIRDLQVRITGDTKGYQKSMSDVQGSNQAGHLSFLKLTAAVAAGQLAFEAAGKAYESVKGALEGTVKKTEELGMSTNKLMRETGMTAEQSSGLLAVFERFGVDAAGASKDLGLFAKQIFAAGNAAAGTVTTFSTLGINVKDANGHFKSTQTVLLEVADKFKTMPNGVEKTAEAMKLFGKSGKEMLPILNQGAAGITELEEHAKKLGVVLTQSNIDAIRKNMIAHRDWQEAMTGVQLQIGTRLMPVIADLTTKLANFVASDKFQGWIKDIGNFVETYVKPAFVWLMNTGLPILGEWAKKTYELADKVITFLAPSLTALWNTVSTQVFPVLQRLWKEVIEPLTPIIGTVLVAAVWAVVNIFNIWWTVLSAVLGWVLDHKQIVIDFALAFGTLAAYMKFEAITSAFTGNMSAIIGSIMGVKTKVVELFTLVSGGSVMGGIAVAGALADIALVAQAVQSVLGAINAMNDAKRQIAANDAANKSQIPTLEAMAVAGTTPQRRASAKNTLHMLGVPGYAEGGIVSATPGGKVIRVAEGGQDEAIVPLPKNGHGGLGGNLHIEVNIGMYAGMPVEKRDIAIELWKELVRAARAQGVQLPMIGAVGVQ